MFSMIKNRCSGESVQGGDDRPRKKLSFRDPEVTPPKSTPLSAPAKTCSPPHFSRPHSVSGVMGLGGFSALGGVPGISNPASSSSSSNSPKGVTASPGIHSPNLPSRLFHHVSSHSPTRLTSRSHSRHSSYEGIQNNHEQENFQEQKEQHSQQVTQKQAHYSSQQHYEHGSQQPHKEQQYRQPQQSPVNHVQQLDQQYPKQDQNPGHQNQNQYPQSLQQNQPHQSAQQTQQQQQLQSQNHPNHQSQLHEQPTQQKQHTVQSKKSNMILQEVQQSHSHESNKQKHNQQQLKNQIQPPQQAQQSQLHLHSKQFSQQQSKNQNQFSHVQQNQFQEYEAEFQYPDHEVQKYHDPQIQQKRQLQQASAAKQYLKTSEKKDQASKSSHKPQQSKVHRHHSLSPKRHTRLDAVPSGRNSDQMLFCHSEDIESENQAMKVVRTVGQAFEVVHKLTLKDKSPSPDSHNDDDDVSREGSEDSSDKPKKDGLDSESGQEDLMTLTSDTYNEDTPENLPNRPSNLEPLAPPIGSEILHKNIGETFASPLGEPLSMGDYLPQTGTPLSVHHELQLLREQLEQQQQQTQAAVAQVHLLRDQLAAETAARLEAQARTHQLLVHNKELLEHIQQLVLQVRELEVKLQGGGGIGGNGVSTTISMPPNPPEMKSELSPSLCGVTDDDASWHSCAKPSSSSSTSSTSLFSPHLLPLLPDTPPTPSPTLAAHTFFFPSTLHSSPQLSTLITPLTLHRQHQDPQIPHTLQQRSHPQHQPQYQTQQQQQAMRQRHYPFSHESGIDVDVKREGVDSSRRLPQVPEDSVSSIPLGASPIGSQWGAPPNGPITRAASERYSRQETLAQLQRMAWARHTTK